jgi:hypothetical protein
MFGKVYVRKTKDVLLMGICDSIPPYLILSVFVCNLISTPVEGFLMHMQ